MLQGPIKRLANVPVNVEGLPQFKRAVDSINRDLPDQLDRAAGDVARDLVGRAQAMAHKPQQALAARSLAVGTSTGAGDTVGASVGASSPLFYGAEFGGRGRPETMQFPAHQGKRGYFLYPAARAGAAAFQARWEKGIDKATEPWDRNGGVL